MKYQQNHTNYILLFGTYPPRECGIATFTQDLSNALDKKFNPIVRIKILALNDQPTSIYNYSSQVAYQITAIELQHYVALAKKINNKEETKIVNIQHEFGIFGGNWGDYLIPFLQVIEKPVVTSFHSVLPNPNDHLKNVVSTIAKLSNAVVVMNKLSQDILEKDYLIQKQKIVLIPHGIPQVPFESSRKAKSELKLENKIVLSTFGMLSANKGIEYAIRALPEVVKKFPNIIYLILGATHPVIRKKEGERYRNFLIAEVERLGLNENVKFYNRYLTLEEIIHYLKATDIYISPTINTNQSVSGTLSYALGCGRPVISTKTAYAKYIIDNKNGVLVKLKDHRSITKALVDVLSNPSRMQLMNENAYEKSRWMTWPNVAIQYFNLYKKFTSLKAEERKLPEIKFQHLRRLTDDFGIIQHAKYSRPQKQTGYSLDDNARALIACARYYRINLNSELLNLMKIYLKFMKFAQRPNGNFTNIISYQKRRDLAKDEDALGRAIWALGYVASRDFLPEEIRKEAQKMLPQSLKQVLHIKSPRAIAFTLTGLYFYLKRFPQKSLFRTFKRLAERQYGFFVRCVSKDWIWFEDRFTYSNSKLPESLLYAYQLTHHKKYLKAAQETLDFLSKITFLKEYYAPIGQNGWYVQNKKRSYFDQQPEDVASMVETKIEMYKATKKRRHLNDAFKAFQWFLGKNHLHQVVYDEATGGCRDGIGEYSMNLNQGAESTISYLMARLAFEDEKVILKESL